MIHVVTFPGLGLEFTLNRVAFHLFGRPIFWYGIIIASGMLLAVYLCSRWAPRFGIVPDHILDMMFFAVPAALVSVRAYYVIFNLDLYRCGDGSLDWGAILRYSDGGLAIYGAIISSVIVLLIFCKVRENTMGSAFCSICAGTVWAVPGSRACGPTACISLGWSCLECPSGYPRWWRRYASWPRARSFCTSASAPTTRHSCM